MAVKMELLSWVFHAHSYAVMKALTRLFGDAQSVSMKFYAEYLLTLAERLGLNLKNPEDFCRLIREKGVVGNCGFKEVSPGEVEFFVENCSLASYTHGPMGAKGYTGDLCPLATVAMVSLALSRGYHRGELLFDYVKFDDKLTYFTADGAKTRFILAGK